MLKINLLNGIDFEIDDLKFELSERTSELLIYHRGDLIGFLKSEELSMMKNQIILMNNILRGQLFQNK